MAPITFIPNPTVEFETSIEIELSRREQIQWTISEWRDRIASSLEGLASFIRASEE